MTDIKKVKLFLSIYIPVFAVVGVVLRNSPALKPVSYGFSGVIILAMVWLVWAMKFRKKKK